MDDKHSLVQFFTDFSMMLLPESKESSQHISKFLNQLMRRNHRKVCNLLFMAGKFNSLCELFVRQEADGQEDEEDGLSQEEQNEQIARTMSEVRREVMGIEEAEEEERLCCNYFNPENRIILRVTAPEMAVRIVMAERFTRYLTILTGTGHDLSHYRKVNSQPSNIRELLQMYRGHKMKMYSFKPREVEPRPKRYSRFKWEEMKKQEEEAESAKQPEKERDAEEGSL